MQPHRRQLVRFSKAARSLCRDPRCPDTFKQQLQEARAEWRRRQPLEVLHLLALPSSRAVRGALKDGLYHAAAFTCTAAGFSVSGQLTMILPRYRRYARMALPSPMRAAAIKIKVVTKSRIVGIIHTSPGQNRKNLSPQSEMRGNRTRWVRTLQVLLLIERRSFQRSVRWSWLFAESPSSSRPSFFQTLNGCPQPALNCLLDLVLIAVSIQGIERLTGYVERNVVAGDVFGTELGRHQVDENTITARIGILFGIVVHASERVFENILRFPRSSRRTAISPLSEEFEFKFQNL